MHTQHRGHQVVNMSCTHTQRNISKNNPSLLLQSWSTRTTIFHKYYSKLRQLSPRCIGRLLLWLCFSSLKLQCRENVRSVTGSRQERWIISDWTRAPTLWQVASSFLPVTSGSVRTNCWRLRQQEIISVLVVPDLKKESFLLSHCVYVHEDYITETCTFLPRKHKDWESLFPFMDRIIVTLRGRADNFQH